jgi:hypothetical protein
MTKIFVHLGHGKTGTTSIQSFLHQASRRHGRRFLYPKTCRLYDPPAHHELFRAGFLPRSKWKTGQDEQMCDALYREIDSTSANIVALSSETGLATMGLDPQSNRYQIAFFEKLRDNFDLKIVYYVRNQIEQIESAFYTQSRTANLSPTGENLRRYIAQELIQFDFWKNVESFWSPLVGEENILSRTYHKDNLLNGDVVQDFLRLTGLTSLLWDGSRAEIIEQHATPQYADPKERGRLMSEANRAILVEAFRDSNMRYAQKYLDRDSVKYLLDGFIEKE